MRTNNQNIFNFVEDLSSIQIPQDSFVVDIQQQISNQNELYDAYKNTITLPDYFGDNWNAFWDVLADLSWVPQKNIIIRHLKMPEIADDELKVYTQILADAVNHWSKFEEHKFQVYFLNKDEIKINQMLAGYESA